MKKDKSRQTILQPSSGETKTGGEAGQLENVDSCRAAETVGDVKEESDEI